ncbi:MAG: S8 family serine peptidase [Verrucomicrobia bacterium]|nr:S8 family serine peptidase [Verrucomicrobiota bacterium]
MLNQRLLWIGLLGALSVAPAAGQQDEFVQLGGRPVHPTRIIARFANEAAGAGAVQRAGDLGLKIHRQFRTLPGMVVFDAADAPPQTILTTRDPLGKRDRLADRITRLRDSGLFAYVEPDYIVKPLLEPTDAAFVDGRLWGLKNTGQNRGVAGADIDAVRAWDATTGSREVIVGVIDTGIRYTHEDLRDQMWTNPGETPGNGVDDDGNGFVDDVFGINAMNGSGNPFDDVDHGTHVAGTIGAAANNSGQHVGVAWNVRLMAAKFLGQAGGTTSDGITCIDYTVANGAKILNNSWGGGLFSTPLLEAIRRARARGVLFVAAAGNDGTSNDEIPHYPSNYAVDNIISVAALDRKDQLAIFSNFGRDTVHIGAPGVEIFSCLATNNTSYGYLDGTSMAAPHVSGVAALIASVFPDSTYADLKEAILASAVPIPALDGRATTGGRLNAFEALRAVATPDGVMEISVDPPSGSTLIAPFAQPVFVRVRDGLGVTNATVKATFTGKPTVNFLNNGQPPDAATGDAVYSASIQLTTNASTLSFNLVLTAPQKDNLTNTVTYDIVPLPPNDNFTNAVKVAPDGGRFVSNNGRATREDQEPDHAAQPTASASLWWKWSPERNSNVYIDTTGSGFGAVLAVYTGGKLAVLKETASAFDPSLITPAAVDFPAVAGSTYYIAVASPNTNMLGSIRLRLDPGGAADELEPVVAVSSPSSGIVVTTNRITLTGTANDPQPNATGISEVLVKVGRSLGTQAQGTTNWTTAVRLSEGDNRIEVRSSDFSGNLSRAAVLTVRYRPLEPVNDLFGLASDLSGLEGKVTVDTSRAGKEPGEPLHAGNEGGRSVWWRWLAPQDGVLTLTTTNSNFDTLLALYTGSRINTLTPIASNDDAFGNVSWSKLSQAVQSGVSYRIAVDGYAGASGQAALNYAFQPTNIFQVTVTATAGGSVTPGAGLFPASSVAVFTAAPEPNFDFVGWLVGDQPAAGNPLQVLVNAALTVNAQFRPRGYADDFETGDLRQLPWSSAGGQPWLVQGESVSAGQFAARSGAIGDQAQSALLLTARMRSGPASFDVRVSSEAEWDLLRFYVNGVLQQEWSGDLGWQSYAFTVPEGLNTLEWRYVKDVNKSSYLDAAFIDNVDLPLVVGVDATTPALLEFRRVYGGNYQLLLQGQPGQTYVIQSSEDLRRWQTVTTSTAVGGQILFTDPQGVSLPQRFYRAVVLP